MVMQSKYLYATEKRLISTQDCHMWKKPTKGKKLSQLVLINAPTLRTLEHVN